MIESTPSEAQVTLSTGQKCVTPCKLKLKRRPGFTAVFEKEGYETQETTVESHLGGGGAVAGAGNILLGGVIGGIVDGTNGSMNNLSPNPLRVSLMPLTEAPAAQTVASAVEGAPAAEAVPIEAVAPATSDAAAEDAAATPSLNL